MKRRRELAAIVAALVAAVACDGATAPVAPHAADDARLTVAAMNNPLSPDQVIARGLALALGDRAVREAVRDAMRASPLTEHKLVLQDFVGTDPGALVVRAVAARLGVGVDSVGAIIAALPALDFYVPGRDQRRSWRATPDVLVAAVLGPDRSVVTGHDVRGVAREVRSGARSPVIMLHPAEPKARRVGPQPLRPGDVIQEEGDGEISGRITWYREGGDSVVAEYADLPYVGAATEFAAGDEPAPSFIEPCEITDPTCADWDRDPVPVPTYPYAARLGKVETRSICDNNNCGEGNEFVFEGNLYGWAQSRDAYGCPSGGTRVSGFRVEEFGFPSSGVRTSGKMLAEQGPGVAGYLRVKVYELDGGLNSDDRFQKTTICSGDPIWQAYDSGKYAILVTFSGWNFFHGDELVMNVAWP